MTVVTGPLAEIQSLYDQGLFLQAFEASRPLGELKDWRETEHLILGGRLAQYLGNPRLAGVMHWLALRHDPMNQDARFYGALWYVRRFGPALGWIRLQRIGDPLKASPAQRADWHLLKAQVLGSLRDFLRAEEELSKAAELEPNDSWYWVNASYIHQRKDEDDLALRAAERALELDATRHSVIQCYTDNLMQLGRIDDARRFLTEASQRFESAHIFMHLAAIEAELHQFDDAITRIEQAMRYLPLADTKALETSVTPLFTEYTYRANRFEEAARHADQCKGEHFVQFAQRLRDPSFEKRRVELPVGFVRQHYLTCAPASLSMIAMFFGESAGHLDIANEICYDGTPTSLQREWLETHGFHAAQFRLDFDTAVTLIDHQIPFILETVAINSAHAQVVMGYDTVRQTLLIREPSDRLSREFDAAKLIERHGAWGPRCMAFVPASRKEMLDAISLPDRELYDRVHRLELALSRNNRSVAEAELAEVKTEAPDSALSLQAESRLAIYDGNLPLALQCDDRLRELFNGDEVIRYHRLGLMKSITSSKEQIEFLKECMKDVNCHPLFLIAEAEQTSFDHQTSARAFWLTKRAVRLMPTDGAALGASSDIRWRINQRTESIEFARLAATTEELDHRYSRTYFIRSLWVRRQDEALNFFRNRYERFKHRSPEPGLLLSWAYEQLNQRHRSLELIEQLLTTHPDTSSVLVQAVRLYTSIGDLDRAFSILEQARGRLSEREWLISSARLHYQRSDLRKSLETWKALLDIEPLSEEAHRSICDILGKLKGPVAVEQHINDALAKYLHSYVLHVLRIETLRTQKPSDRESAIRQMLDVHPNDGWALRELLGTLIDQSRFDEAEQVARTCNDVAPYDPNTHYLQAGVHRATGRLKAAKKSYRQCIKCDVDFEWALIQLLHISSDKSERIQHARFFLKHLIKQVTSGQAIVAFWRHTGALLDSKLILSVLKRAWRERPDLWQSWHTLGQQLIGMNRLDDAIKVIRRSIRRFPYEIELHTLLADTYERQQDFDSAIKCVKHVLSFSPHCPDVHTTLGLIIQHSGDLEGAKTALKRAVSLDHQNSVAMALLGEVYFVLGHRSKALALMEKGVKLNPANDAIWDRYQEWSVLAGKQQQIVTIAEKMTTDEPFNLLGWQRLVQAFAISGQEERRLDAADRCIDLDQFNLFAYDQKALALQALGRWDEAFAACHPSIYGEAPPAHLVAREAQLRVAHGDFKIAKDIARSLVDREPDFHFGVRTLVDALFHIGPPEEYRQAADRLVELNPNDADSYLCRATGRQKLKDREGEKKDLVRVIELAPAYAPAFHRLIEILLAEKKFDEAFEFIDKRAPHTDAATTEVFKCMVAQKKTDKGRLARGIDELAMLAEVNDDALRMFAQIPDFLGIGGKSADRILELIQGSRNQATLGSIWAILTFRDRGTAALMSGIPRFGSSGKAWRGAVYAMPYLIGQSEFAHFKSFAIKYKDWLRKSDKLWCIVTQLYARFDSFLAANWAKDWKQRKNIDPETEFLLSNALWHLGQNAEAARLCERSLTIREDIYSPYHRTRLAVWKIHQGDYEAARALSRKGLADFDNGPYRNIAQGVQVTLEGLERPSGGLKSAKRLVSKMLEFTGNQPQLAFSISTFTDAIARHHAVNPKKLSRSLPASARPVTAKWIQWAVIGGTVIIINLIRLVLSMPDKN